MGFPDGSDGKESAFNVEGPGLIPEWERSSGEGNGHPSQFKWGHFKAWKLHYFLSELRMYFGDQNWEECAKWASIRWILGYHFKSGINLKI